MKRAPGEAAMCRGSFYFPRSWIPGECSVDVVRKGLHSARNEVMTREETITAMYTVAVAEAVAVVAV